METGRVVVLQHERKAAKSLGHWISLAAGIFLLFFSDGILWKIGGLVAIVYSIYILRKKIKVVVYTDGFIITDGSTVQNIFFDKVFWLAAGFDQKMKILQLDKPISEYSEKELKEISKNKKNAIVFDDEILQNDFKLVFGIVEEEFKKYVLNKYNNNIEAIINSPYLMQQIQNDTLIFENTLTEAEKRKVVELQNRDAVSVIHRKKNQVTTTRQSIVQAGKSFEPTWKFAANQKKFDTVYLFNRSIVQEILMKKYNMTFV